MAPTNRHARRVAATQLAHARQEFTTAFVRHSREALIDALTRVESSPVNR